MSKKDEWYYWYSLPRFAKEEILKICPTLMKIRDIGKWNPRIGPCGGEEKVIRVRFRTLCYEPMRVIKEIIKAKEIDVSIHPISYYCIEVNFIIGAHF